MSTIGSRLRKIRFTNGLSQRAFSEKFGMPQTTYAKYELDKAGIPDVFKQQLAQTGINLHWLITGDGSMHYEDQAVMMVEDGSPAYSPVSIYNEVQPNRKEQTSTNEGTENVIAVPILAKRLSDGFGRTWVPTDFTDEKLPLLGRFIQQHQNENFLAAQVRGDSMIGIQLYDGDVVFFVRSGLKGDGIYVFTVEGEVHVKRLEVDPFEHKIVIHSENERYRQKAVEPDCMVILGKVIGWVHCHPY